MTTTPNRNYGLIGFGPNGWMSEDLATFNANLGKIDGDVHALFLALAGKRDADASIGMDKVTGLTDALTGKAAAGHSHQLADLSDVDAAQAGEGYLLARQGEAWVPVSVNAVFGQFSVNINSVDGLADALNAKAASDHNHDAAYLGKTAQAEDSKKLGGALASLFAKLTGGIFTGPITLDLPGHVNDGGNDYGLFVKSYEPAITLIDKSPGQYSGLVGFFTDRFKFQIDSNNDGTIGHSTSTTTKDALTLIYGSEAGYLFGEQIVTFGNAGALGGAFLGNKSFTSSGTYALSAGTKFAYVILIGGGGGANTFYRYTNAIGGHGAQIGFWAAIDSSGNLTVVVGAPGSNISSDWQTAPSGGDTSALGYTAKGGEGSTRSTPGADGGYTVPNLARIENLTGNFGNGGKSAPEAPANAGVVHVWEFG